MNKRSNILSLFFVIFFFFFYTSTVFAAIQFPDFRSISSDEANPALAGMERRQRFAQDNMMFAEQLRAQRLQNQMVEHELEQKQKKNQLKIMIFSQNEYPSYLGCFNCPIYAED